MKVGDRYHVTVPMSGKGDVVWVVEQLGDHEVKVSGVWLKVHQIERWIRRGEMVPLITTRASAQEQ